jgi:tetratricopeptide (TPR) repeat protein
MISVRMSSLALPRRGINPWLALVVLSCASTSATRSAGQSASRTEFDPATQSHVQVVGQPTTSADGQTSWILEQDVRRTPKIAGMNAALPPHIERRMNYAFDLAQRGATYSAATEFQAVLGLCALELDSRSGGSTHREALRQGLIALDEADQFGGEQVDWRDSADVRRIADGHTTPVLNQAGQAQIDSIQAVQAYYSFAEQRLAYACQGLPGASMAFYGLGRTITVPGMRVAHATGKAALYHRIALTIAPQNVLAANELGVLLAQHGELEGAEKLLQYCVAVEPSPQSYRNLSIVYAQKGDQRSSQAAQAAGEVIATRKRNQAEANAAATLAAQSSTGVSEAEADAEKPQALEKFQEFLTKFQASSLVPKVFRR